MNPAPTNPRRVSKLQKRFHDVISGSVKLDPRGAALFLEGLCVQEDPVVCLNALVGSTNGLPSVQSAMRADLSVEFMNGLGSTVLDHLLRTCDVGGDALDNLLFHVVEPPIFWDAFVRSFQQGTLSEDAQLIFAKLLSRLLALHGRDTTPYRSIAAQSSIQDALVSSPKHEIREIGHLIKHVLSGTDLAVASYLLNGPGGRHDNDFANYRDISILPTADEILSKQPPFLRAQLHDETRSSETLVEDYLDNTFRMLREDLLFDIREEVEVALQRKGKHPHVVHDISMIGVHVATDDRRSRWGIKLRCGNDFKQLNKIVDERSRQDFLRYNPRGQKIMKHQSLACLASGLDIISFGVVNRVEELLACKPPVIVLQLDGAVNIKRTLTALCTLENIRLVQVEAAMFSFEPVLTALQKMKAVPLEGEILLWKPETPITPPQKRVALSNLAKRVASKFSTDLSTLLALPTSINLDKSQAKSLIAGLTQRVSLIQGPPGTGKSFIGAILAKAIHDKTSETILIVCYTNHALDQFLQDLLDYDIPTESMVRLGGRPSQAMEKLSLQNQPRGRFEYNWDEINGLRACASGFEHSLLGHFRELEDDHDTHLIKYLEAEHCEFFDAFHVSPTTEDGMTLVGENGRAIDDRYLFSRWSRGLDAGVLSGEPHVQASARIWGMDHSARQQLLATWRHERVTKITESVCQVGAGYNKAHDSIRREFGESTIAVLRNKRIIACTTTGAAIYGDSIKVIGPKFLLVEEAGEILESHVLTALSQEVDQMILIGDHKQLRPKVNNYQLTVERGEGFDLNRSLFERLVLQGYPHETLSTQHRMRPEISAFVRELTYPELLDAPSTLQRPHVRGVPSDIIFVDHSHPEDDNTLISDRTEGSSKSSKQNSYEVQMVLKIVRYLAQQGYKGEDIVVLTPYLGQLHLLRDTLKHDNDLILNDLDSGDLARAGISPSEPSGRKTKKGRIHLATIDNYQGEESDIVVASLTRSNASNTIGFMDSPERLNVLLSRARNGLILIGNSQTFLRSKKGGALWGRFFHLLDNGPYVYQGFPVKCEKHPGRTVLLKHASDFDVHCPDGGCTDPCGFTLACGHTCPLKCHPQRTLSSSSSFAIIDQHDTSQCKHVMYAKCPTGRHGIEWACGSGPPSVCSACEEVAKRLEEIARQALERQTEREEAEAEHRRRMADLETSLWAQAEASWTVEERGPEEAQRQSEELAREERRKEEEQRRRQEEHKKRVEQRRAEKRRAKLEEKQKKRAEKKRRREEKKARKENEAKLRASIKQEGEGEQAKRQPHEKGQGEETKGKKREPIQVLQEATDKRTKQPSAVGCKRHPGRTILLQGTDTHRPEVGCAEICGFAFPCGHKCLLKCHDHGLSSSSSGLHVSNLHDASQCKYTMHGKCLAGRHDIEWQCATGPPPLCSACNERAKKLEETCQRAIERQQQRKGYYRLRMDKQVEPHVEERMARAEGVPKPCETQRQDREPMRQEPKTAKVDKKGQGQQKRKQDQEGKKKKREKKVESLKEKKTAQKGKATTSTEIKRPMK